IAMEFVEGKTIKELIKRRGALEESAAIEIVLQVLDGLRHAWENNLVHRDVKPANIMITKEGQAKLLDLGLVRRTDAANELTGEGKAIGTPYFMAPEQALDKGADYRADIYALGATLF
ncbi:MAG TPA: serine/threonine protein kinase, partial [Planctomycetes bacterium]|nr:serine/threonine protein kinase [Planctomycetota bacterium]